MPVAKRVVVTPYWQSSCQRAAVYLGDNMHVMMHLDTCYFHTIVTDPPYGLEFMGREWDAPWRCVDQATRGRCVDQATRGKQEGSVDARDRRSAELDDPVKSKYLRHNTTYGMSDPALFQQWFFDRAVQMLRVAKPGAH